MTDGVATMPEIIPTTRIHNRIVMETLTGLDIWQGVFTARYNTLLVVQSRVTRLAENYLKNS